jgi:hypothetical protein
MVCGTWPIAAVEGRAYRQTCCGPRPEPGMRSVQQRGPGPGPVPGPIPGPDPDAGPPRRQPGVSTQRHWRPMPEPGTTPQTQRAGVSSAEPEADEWGTMGARTGADPALLLAPAPAANRSTATITSNLGFISFLPQLPPQAIGPRRFCNYVNAAHGASSLRMIVPTCSPRNAGSSSSGFSPLMIWIRLTCRALASRSISTRSKGSV